MRFNDCLPLARGSVQCFESQRATGKLQVPVYSNISGWGGASMALVGVARVVVVPEVISGTVFWVGSLC